VRRVVLLAAAALLLGAQAPGLDAERRRLAEARAEAAAARGRADALAQAADDAADAAAEARARQRALAARVRAAEAELRAAEARVGVVGRLLDEQRARLASVQTPAARLMAALQAFARRPSVAAVAQPGTVADLVHLRAVLGGALPVVAARSGALRTELERSRRLEAGARLAATALGQGRARLETERAELARAEATQTARAAALGRDALGEGDRALALGERARDLVDRMEAEGAAVVTAASLKGYPAPQPRPVAGVPPERAAGTYRLPVEGRLTTGFDAVSRAGVRARGLTFAVAPSAAVSAPAAGTVRFARSFRGYRGVVILDHGEGWTTTLLGLGAIGVRPGQAVAAGAPVGQAAAGEDPAVTVELRRRGRPVDLTAML
jgi:murein hydrolase activator